MDEQYIPMKPRMVDDEMFPPNLPSRNQPPWFSEEQNIPQINSPSSLEEGNANSDIYIPYDPKIKGNEVSLHLFQNESMSTKKENLTDEFDSENEGLYSKIEDVSFSNKNPLHKSNTNLHHHTNQPSKEDNPQIPTPSPRKHLSLLHQPDKLRDKIPLHHHTNQPSKEDNPKIPTP